MKKENNSPEKRRHSDLRRLVMSDGPSPRSGDEMRTFLRLDVLQDVVIGALVLLACVLMFISFWRKMDHKPRILLPRPASASLAAGSVVLPDFKTDQVVEVSDDDPEFYPKDAESAAPTQLPANPAQLPIH